jgi:hypothetical protein
MSRFSKLVVVTASLMLTGAILWMINYANREEAIGPQSYNRVHLGMSEKQIAGIIGLATGNYYKGRKNGKSEAMDGGPWGTLLSEQRIANIDLEKADIRWLCWIGTSYGIDVAVDKNGEAIWKRLNYINQPRPHNLFDWLFNR